MIENTETEETTEQIPEHYMRPFGVCVEYRDAMNDESSWKQHNYVEDAVYQEDIYWEDADISTDFQCIDLRLAQIQEIK